MAFDLATAEPVEAPKKGFDLSTAAPVEAPVARATTAETFPKIDAATQAGRDADSIRIKRGELHELDLGLNGPKTPGEEREMRASKAAIEQELRGAGATVFDLSTANPVATPSAPAATPTPRAPNVSRETSVSAPTTDELATAARPARMVSTRGGQPVVVPEKEPGSSDLEISAPPPARWTGKGGVLESLPEQLVAGAAGAAANLRRMSAQEGVNQRAAVVAPATAAARGTSTPDVRDLIVPADDQNTDKSKWAKRADGSDKGFGHLGLLRRADGGVSSEISIGVEINGKEVEIPTMVPTLTRSEVETLLNSKDIDPNKIPDSIVNKAVAFAQQRIAQGKSPFASPQESPTVAGAIPAGGGAPQVAETGGGAATAIIRPRALERQQHLLTRDTADLQAAKTDAEFAADEQRRITPANMTTAQQAATSLVQSAPATALGLGAGILTRSPQLAMAIAGVGGAQFQAGSTYGEAIDKGASHRTASVAASIDAILEGAGEALPLGVAMKAGTPVVARMLHTVAAEAGQEAATQLAQDLNAYMSYDPNITLQEAWENMKMAAVAGAMGGVGYGAVGHAAAHARQPQVDIPLQASVVPAQTIGAPRAAPGGFDIATAVPVSAGPRPAQVPQQSAGPAAATANQAPHPAPQAQPQVIENATNPASINENSANLGTAPGTPPPGSAADLRSVMADSRPLDEIRAEQDAAQAELEAEQVARAPRTIGNTAGMPIDFSDWFDVGGGYQARRSTSHPIQEIRTPDGNVITRGVDSNGKTYEEFESPTALQPGGMSWVNKARADLTGLKLAPPGNATPRLPVIASTAADLDAAVERINHDATPAQKEAGNYAKAHVRLAGPLAGLGDIAIETAKGQTRVAHDGSWESPPLPAHYGEIKRSPGADGDKLDIFLGDNLQAPDVFIIDQVDPETGAYDESKLIAGFNNEDDAVNAYLNSFSDDATARVGAISKISASQAVNWVHGGDTTKPFSKSLQESSDASTVRRDQEGGNEQGNAGKQGAVESGRDLQQQASGAASERGTPDRRGTEVADAAAAPGGTASTGSQSEPAGGVQRGTASGGGTAANEAGNANGAVANETAAAAAIDGRSIYRGYGRDNKLSAYGERSTGVPIAGNAKYYTFDKAAAKKYGPKVEEKTLDLENPLVITDGQQWRALTKEAGWEYPNPSGVLTKQQAAALKNVVTEKGHDGIVVDWDDASGLDIGPNGENLKLLNDVFGEPQVVDYRTESEALPETLGAPATLGAPRSNSPSNTYAKPRTANPPQPNPDLNTARPDSIRDAIRKLFNVPINEKGIKIRRALGIYKTKPQTIRVRNKNDIGVIAHEVGHHFSETSKAIRQQQKTHAAELLNLTPAAYAKEPRALRLEEGFAEFIRHYLSDPQFAQQAAPGFYKAFDAYIDKTAPYREIFDIVQKQIIEWQSLDPTQRIMAKVGRTQVPILDKVKSFIGVNRLIWQVLDQWHPMKMMVDSLDAGIRASKDPYKAARLLAGDGAIIEDWLTQGAVPFDLNDRMNPKGYGKPLKEILKPVADDIDDFMAYLIAKRADELRAQDKENLFSDTEIDEGLKLETPAFKKAAAEIYKFQDDALQYAVDGGLISDEVATKFRDIYRAYVPFFRESDTESSGAPNTNGHSTFKKLTGGTSNVQEVIGNIIQNVANIIHATNRNAVMVKAMQLADSVNGGGKWIESIPMPMKATSVSTDRIIEQLEKKGVVIDKSAAQALDQMQTFFNNNPVGDEKHNIFIVKVNGEPKAIQVNEPMLAESLKRFQPLELDMLGKMLAWPADLLRAGVVLTPDFMVRNFMRDTISGYMQAKTGMVPVLGTLQGYKEVATKSDAYRLYRAYGGAHADMWMGDTKQTRKILLKMAATGKFPAWSILTPSSLLSLLKHVGSITEAGTRVAEFKTEMKPDADSMIDAAIAAREVSVDFGMHGANRTIRLLARITPFLNPAFQGLYKGARTFADKPMQTLLRGSAITLFSALLYSMNHDKDWYDDIEQWEKNTYWHVDIGMRKDGKVVPLRIPKPFEWGAAFASIPEGIMAYIKDHSGEKLLDRIGSVLSNVFGIRAIPTAALLPWEIGTNKDSFTGRPIVPDSVSKVDPALQFTPNTSLTDRAIGKYIHTSPAQLDHIVRGIFGTLGLYSLSVSDLLLRHTGDYPAAPTTSKLDWPVIRSFIRNPDNANTQYVTDFYKHLEESQRAANSMKRIEGDDKENYRSSHEFELRQAPSLGAGAKAMSSLRKATNNTLNDRIKTPDEKRQFIDHQNELIRARAKARVKQYETNRQDFRAEKAKP